jgi:hypothetical protein
MSVRQAQWHTARVLSGSCAEADSAKVGDVCFIPGIGGFILPEAKPASEAVVRLSLALGSIQADVGQSDHDLYSQKLVASGFGIAPSSNISAKAALGRLWCGNVELLSDGQ